nr:MAG TPA: hypothetical protein [Caudoviricetes sp.]
MAWYRGFFVFVATIFAFDITYYHLKSLIINH